MHKSANQSSNCSPIPSIPSVKQFPHWNDPGGFSARRKRGEEKKTKTKKQLQQKDCPFWQNILIFGTNRIKGGGSKRTTAINPSGRKHRGGRLLRRNYVLHKVDGIMRYQKRKEGDDWSGYSATAQGATTMSTRKRKAKRESRIVLEMYFFFFFKV